MQVRRMSKSADRDGWRAIAPAKLNLTLHITGKREDGYHLLESLVAFADIGDVVSLVPADVWSLEVQGPFAEACGACGDNLVMQAAQRLQAHLGQEKPAAMRLDKQLPVGAGLGGGSSDAAAMCKLLLRYWGVIMPELELAQILFPLGADLPMCVAARPLIAHGIGEEITILPSFPALYAVLCWPGIALDTRAVYGAYRHESLRLAHAIDVSGGAALLAALEPTRNMLQKAAVSSAPEVMEALLALSTLPRTPFVRMTGSGACCVAYFLEESDAEAAAQHMSARYPGWWIRKATLSV